MVTNVAKLSESKEDDVKPTIGVTYTRWGNNKCPTDISGTSLLYSGTMAGAHYTHKGGGANFLCLPEEPDYKTLKTSYSSNYAPLYGTEYEYPIAGIHDHGVPCAVCYVSGRSAKVMLPAITSCPDNTWTKEYIGYIMAGHYGHRRNEYVCIDKEQRSRPGSAGNQNGALLYQVRATCTGIHCPPYDPNKALTCVVCSK